MKTLPACLSAALACLGFYNTASAQSEQTPAFFTDGIGYAYEIEWFGVDGRTYFIKHSDDLEHWQYYPEILSGEDLPIGFGFTTSADRFFVRVMHSDIPTTDPEGADFDGDGLSNWDELTVYLFDPLSADSDGDGMADGWEIQNGTTVDFDGDGLSDSYELAAGTDESVAKTPPIPHAATGLLLLTPAPPLLTP